jgi:16S rRNA (uracil1498-N3)-methyltransferase
VYTSAMAKTTPRLFVDQELAKDREFELAGDQAHYLLNVLRLAQGDPVHVFNNNAGEFSAYVTQVQKKHVTLRCEVMRSGVKPPPDIDYLFAPLKHARLDYMVQKATELGARRLRPVMTARTIAERVNLERMRANAIEAAEQCNLVHVPEVCEPVRFTALLATWPQERALVFCDETAANTDPLERLDKLQTPTAVLVGPEGGFTNEERQLLLALPTTHAISLGPRILRADTAAIAALALVQATIGDWTHNKS